MTFSLTVNVNAFPKCNKCKNDMALVKVVETETESFEKGTTMSLSMPSGRGSDEKRDAEIAVFVWKCSCGNTITDKTE